MINSVVCEPARNARLKPGKVIVSGYALPPGQPDRTVNKVELSTDAGNTWTEGEFKSRAKPFCWRLWIARLTVTEDTRAIVVRVTDSGGNVQPQTVAWNLKGYLFNAWHRTPVDVKP